MNPAEVRQRVAAARLAQYATSGKWSAFEREPDEWAMVRWLSRHPLRFGGHGRGHPKAGFVELGRVIELDNFRGAKPI